MAKAKDKRKYPRVSAKNVHAHVNVSEKSTPCTIQDLSAGGMFIETRETLPVGMPVSVNVAQPGWTRVLRLAGRVVWAMAQKTASRKGTVPGMRIRFDPLDVDSAEMLLELLRELGVDETPPPERIVPVPAPHPSVPGAFASPAAKTQELSLKDIVARISRTDVPAVPNLKPTAVVTPAPERAHAAHERLSAGRAQPLLDAVSATAASPADAPRLVAQVKGLLLQLADLQQTLEHRERELSEAREALHKKELALEKAERERRAAEMAIQRLSMQLAARR